MSDKDAPDFSMVRAVEILARIAEGKRPEYAPPPPIDRPMLFFSETIGFEIGVTTREKAERALGIAFSYPTRGWHTYAVNGAQRAFLSAFYKDALLVACELYMPRGDHAPSLAPRALTMRLVPGEIVLGATTAALTEAFVRVPSKAAAFDETFEARFPGGVAYAMTRKGAIDRFALYTA